MLRTALLTTVALLAGSSLVLADAKDDVKGAAQKLADAASYSWKTNSESTGGNGRGFGPKEGKTEKGGYCWVVVAGRDNDIEVVKKGDKAAIKMDDGWKSLSELEQDNGNGGQPGPGRFMGRMVQNFRLPAQQAEDLAGGAKELKESDGAFAGELTPEGLRQAMPFGRRRGGNNNNNNNNAGNGNGNAPDLSQLKGTVKFWTKDGMLSKYEYHVTGTVNFGGQDRDIDRTTTVEVSDVGSTKVTVPDEAKKKLE